MDTPAKPRINPARRHRSESDASSKKQSFLGSMSCGIAALSLFLALICVPLKGSEGLGSTVLLIALIGTTVGMAIVGFGLAVAGLTAKRRRKLFSIIGMVTNPLVVVLLGLYLWWPTSHALIAAADSGNVKDVQRALAFGVDVNASEPFAVGGQPDQERTAAAIIVAAEGGWEDVLDTLIQHGAEVNTTDSLGNTPLYYATQAGHLEAVRILLKKGADPNAGSGEQTPLYHAAGRGRWRFVDLLLQHGAKVNPIGAVPPLIYAAKAGHTQTIDRLLEHGADPGATDQEGYTALHLAAAAGHTHSLGRLLRAKADPNATNLEGESPLELAVLAERDGIVRQLIDAGAKVDVYAAVGLNDEQTLNHLLEKDPGLAKLSRRGRSPLHLACERGLIKPAETLIAHGADVNARTEPNTGITPLHLAIYNQQESLIKLLLENGADPNMSVKADRAIAPPLYFAVQSGMKSAVEMLLKHGADVNAPCDTHWMDGPPLFFAINKNHEAIVDLLIQHNADVNARQNRRSPTPLYEAVTRGNVAIVELLLANGAQPNDKVEGRSSPTALSLATERLSQSPWAYQRILLVMREHGATE